MPSLFIKNVPEDLYKKLEEMANASGRTKADIVIEALQLRIFGQQVKPDSEMVEYTEPKFKEIQFPTKCARCGKIIEAGEYGYLSKAKYKDGTERWLAWHAKCFITNKQLAKLDLEIWKRKQILKGYEELLKEYRETVSEAEARRKVLDIAKEVDSRSQRIEQEFIETSRDIRDFLMSVNAGEFRELAEKLLEEHRKLHEEIQEGLNDLRRRLEEVAATMAMKPIKKPSKKRREEVWE